MKIITISREFGSGGRELGKRVWPRSWASIATTTRSSS